MNLAGPDFWYGVRVTASGPLAEGGVLVSLGVILLLLLAGLGAFFGVVLSLVWAVLKFLFFAVVGQPERVTRHETRTLCQNPRCRIHNRAGAHFCARCGAALEHPARS